MSVEKVMDHEEYPKSIKNLSDRVLRAIMRDCRDVLALWDEHPNASYYADEMNYCADELYQRRKAAGLTE